MYGEQVNRTKPSLHLKEGLGRTPQLRMFRLGGEKGKLVQEVSGARVCSAMVKWLPRMYKVCTLIPSTASSAQNSELEALSIIFRILGY